MQAKYPKESIYILIPVHNRREITLRCLDHLKQQKILEEYCVVVIDDGSTDGTTEEIKVRYPEVSLLQGDGNLWWTGAICLGMKHAHQMKAKYFIWMNDDTLPIPGAISLMINKCIKYGNTITCAQCYKDYKLKYPTYGGHKKEFLKVSLFHTPFGEIYPCDFMSGNLVCFPISVIDKIGLPPSNKLPHNMADVIYTWKAKKSGFNLIVCGDAMAICALNPYEEGMISSPIPVYQRWKLLFTYKSNLYPPAFWYYCQSLYGLFAPVAFVKAYSSFLLITIFRLILPLYVLDRIRTLKECIFGSNSSALILREGQNNNNSDQLNN
jgi:GT2 family glycosyltransferase